MKLQDKVELGYSFTIDPETNHNGVVDIILSTLDGKRYFSSFITPEFIKYIFEKNERTGECAGGKYFTMPNIVIVKEIEPALIKETIDDLINNYEIDNCFSELH